jgi:DNA primase
MAQKNRRPGKGDGSDNPGQDRPEPNQNRSRTQRTAGRLDLEAIRQANPLPSVVGASIRLMRAGNEFRACCPFHADKSPSFTIFANGTRFHCFGCGASGDVLDFVRRAHGIGLREAAEWLSAGNLPSVHVQPVPPQDDRNRIAEARAIWCNAVPASGTPAERYLRSRGLHLPIPESIRFAVLPYGRGAREYPCLVAAVGSVDHKLTGIQRTYLRETGDGKAAVPKPKLSLGRIAGGAIRLAPCAGELMVCEGLEDGLTLQQEMGRAVWVAAGASMLPAMQFPAGVRSVVIGADGDEAGEAAAQKAAAAFLGRRLRVRIIRPPCGSKDFNDAAVAAAKAERLGT